MLSSVNKRPHCVLEVCTNAGRQGSWQHGLRNLFASSSRWHFTEVPVGVQLASWMDAASVAEDRKGMDPGEARRLFDNEWVDPGEERGFLTLAEAEACVDPSLHERDRGESSLPYYAVVDYGGVDDRTAAVGMGLVYAVAECPPACSGGPTVVEAQPRVSPLLGTGAGPDRASARNIFGMGGR
jgi:hypothetical protein